MANLNIIDIQNKIGYKFKDYKLLFAAFTHSSYANFNDSESYERLEFLGDSILGYVIAKYLFHKFGNEDQGFLTKTRAKIVNAKSLCQVVESMDIAKHMLVVGSITGEKVKSDLFESIIGAIMLDSGLPACEKFILDKMQPLINKSYTEENIEDYKTKVLELCAQQGRSHDFNCYQKNEEGNILFYATLKIDNATCGRGVGGSKKRAEQKAAQEALRSGILYKE